MTGPNALAAPYVFDIRGRGAWWAIEFDFENATNVDFKGHAFAMLVQARAMELGMILMGFTGGANLEGTKGDHLMLSPAYNTTEEETRKIAELLVRSVNDILQQYSR